MALFGAMLKNINSKSLNREKIGYTIKHEFGPITIEDFMDYIEATKDNASKYSGENIPAPPFFMSKLLYPMFREILVLKGLNLNLLKMVHGQQDIIWHRPIKTGDSLSMEMSVRDIVETPGGELLNVRTRGFTDGEVMQEAVTSFIIRGTGSMIKKDKKNKQKPKELKEAFRADIKTDEGQQLKYADVSGDTNFMHTSNILSKTAGLKRTIMHGVCLVAMTCNTLLDRVIDGDIERLSEISVRFASPVYPGDTFTIVAFEPEKDGEIEFMAVNKSGKPVLKNGIFRFK